MTRIPYPHYPVPLTLVAMVALLVTLGVPNSLAEQPAQSPTTDTPIISETQSPGSELNRVLSAPTPDESPDSEPNRALPASRLDESGTDSATDVEIQRRFNELQRELLDDRREFLDKRSKDIDWWLTAIIIFLTFFAIIVAIIGIFGFQRFREIEKEARQSVLAAEKHAEQAGHVVKEIEAKRDEAQSLLKDINAETAHNDPDKASEVVETVQQSSAASLTDRVVADAISLQQQGKVKEAIEKWRSIADVAEGVDSQLQARAWFSVGYLHGEEDNREASIDAYDKTIELNPNDAPAHNNRGNAKDALGQYEAALADYNEAIRLDPGLAEAYNNRGITKRNLGQPEAALADYNEAIRLKPDYANAYNNRGNAKSHLSQHGSALVDFDEAIRLKPDYANAYNGRGNVKYDLGQPDEALADYNEAIRLDPDFANAYNNRGITKRNLGRLNDAREDFQTALALAQESGNEDLIAKVKRNLSQLDNDQAP